MHGLGFRFTSTSLADGELALRDDVRRFLHEPHPGWSGPHLGFSGFSPEFSKELAARGWVGMAIPREYGGSGRTAVERFLVAEELLRAGAPVGAHWIADRQSAPMILAFGTERQRRFFLPKIASGECYFSIGMSEPDAGSDLASVRTTARRVDGGWRLRGRKVWTSNAHLNHYCIVLCRSERRTDDRHAGLSQVILDLAAPGVQVRPLRLLDGSHHFNELVLDDVLVPDDMALGDIGSGWRQVTAELSFERAGPDRYLTTYPLLQEFLGHDRFGPTGDRGLDEHRGLDELGRLGARLWAIRQLGLAVARSVDRGHSPGAEAALVKDLGTRLEQDIVRVVAELVDEQPSLDSADRLLALLADATLNAPSFTIRGGTSEILRSVAARRLEVGQ